MQQPLLCFSDHELRRCRVEVNHLGLPRPMTGAFASVYRLSNLSGTSWAVRCFLEQRVDMKERYGAIRDAVNNSELEFFAKFEYLERGIKVRNDWYPILKMEWVDGDSLDKYLDRHVKTRTKVAALHKQFREMVAKLKSAGIAHGDLQHGNILVTEEGLRLIDYDDMFVSALSGKVSHELGHRNFQHPDRSYKQFSSDLDNYSTWVIDLCMKALVVDPDTWRDHNGGDDCLLLRHKDFKEPDESSILKYLMEHDESDLRESAILFREMLRLTPDRVPDYQSDARTVGQLTHLQSVEVIAKSEDEVFGEASSESGANGGSTGGFESSFVDYDRWLASVEERKQPSKKRNRALERLKAALSIMCRQVVKVVASHIVPYQWARGVVDEANREYDEGNLVNAVKLYSDVIAVLNPPDERKIKTKRARNLKTATLLCETMLNLGYCYVQQKQLGTAAHYFGEMLNKTKPNQELGAENLRAKLLLSATYFDLDQQKRAFEKLEEVKDAGVLIGAVNDEKDGPYGSSLTLPAMLTELGHKYLAVNDFKNAQSAYQASMHACQWMKDDKQAPGANLIIARAACGFCSTRVAEEEVSDALKQFCELIDTEDSETLRSLIKAEIKGPLKSDWKFAELMRALGHHLDGLKKRDQAQLAYTAGLTVFRQCEGTENLQLKVADCLLGLGKSMEAVAIIRDGSDWTKGHSPDLALQISGIQDFSHALVVSTVVFDDDIQKHRYQCLDSLLDRCPGPDSFEKAITSLEASQIGDKIAFAELMLELARDLKKTGRAKVAKCAYAAAFKALKRGGADERYGSSVMECLLAMGDLDVAANLLIDGGKLEDMVRLMVNVMVSQHNYDRSAICELMVKVADTQMARPPASVTEEEIKETIDLLVWCAGPDSEIIVETQEKAARWLANREMAFAHNLVDQGKFSEALKLFEKHEGPTGQNVLLVQEIWILNSLSAALIERDRGFVTPADGWAFSNAVNMLADMRDKHVLTPSFATKVAELIRTTRIAGGDRYLEEVYTIFCQCGRGFENAVLSLRDCLNPDSRAIIERRLNIKGNEDVRISISDGKFELEIDTIPDANAIPQNPVEPGVDSWRQMHRALFLIDRDDYTSAIADIEQIFRTTTDAKLISDAHLLQGYSYLLMQEDPKAERSFKNALRAVANTQDRFRYNKAALCISMLFQRGREKHRYLRQLMDPSLSQRDVFKVATQLVGKTMSESDNLSDMLAVDLLRMAERNEKTSLTSARIFRATLAILGIKNASRRLEIIYCLDALGKHQAAAIVLKRYVDKEGSDVHVTELVMKLSKRHIKTASLERICQLYGMSGINFEQFVVGAQEDHVVGSLSKVLAGHVPRRLLFEVRQDLISFYGRGRLSEELCLRLSEAIVEGITADTTGERRNRFLNDLLGIARVLEKINSDSAAAIRLCLERAATRDGDANPLDEELFPMQA